MVPSSNVEKLLFANPGQYDYTEFVKEYVNENTYNSEVNYIYSDENFIWIATTNNFYIHDINTGERKNISNQY